MNQSSDNFDSDLSNQDTEKLLELCSELKRGLSRLSYVGMGVNDELDKELSKLRSIIKDDGNIEEIKGVIDLISKILRTLDDDSNHTEINNANERLDLLSQLLKNQLPKKLKKKLKQVQKKSTQSTKSTKENAPAIVRSIADVIHSYVSEIESDINRDSSLDQNIDQKINKKPKKKRGFLSSLFSKKEKTVPANEESKKSKKSERVPQKIKDSLQHLIDQLSSMDGYSKIAELLNQEVKKIKEIEQLANLLEMITGAFIEVSDQDHIQFETFLKTLNKRIVRVNNFINQTLQFSQASNENSKQLNLDLSDNISDIKEELNASETLDDAKNAVFLHMDSIVQQINLYCTKQENDSQSLVSQMDRLADQLKATEDEATRLKDDLAEQRVRAQTDPLTGLPNRYSYNERLTQEYNRWRRYRNSLALVMADIDLFKKINDQQGHAFGDQVLKSIADFLSDGVRESDFIARFGGEEFVLLLPETSIVDATRAMNKLRSGIAKLKIKNGNELVAVSMSFGVSEFENHDTAKSVFERADKALYRAKEKGRNKVCCQRLKSA